MVSRGTEQSCSGQMPVGSEQLTPPKLPVIIEPEDNPIEQAAEALAAFDIACRYLYYAIEGSIETPLTHYPKRVREAIASASRFAEGISQALCLPPFTTGLTQNQDQKFREHYLNGFLSVAEYDLLTKEER